MPRSVRTALSGAILALACVMGATGAQAAARCLPPAQADQAAIVAAMNQMRAQARLAPVQANGPLSRAAAQQSCRQAQANRLTHDGAGGLGQRVRRTGYAASVVAENVAAGQVGVSGVGQMWAASSPHRANMMNPRIRHVAIAQAIAADGRTRYWTLVMAAPR